MKPNARALEWVRLLVLVLWLGLGALLLTWPRVALAQPLQSIVVTVIGNHDGERLDLVFRTGFPANAMHFAQGDRASICGDVARAYRWPLRHLGDRVAPLALARMVPDGDAHPSIPALRRCLDFVDGFGGPIAVVWGDRDPVLGRVRSFVERRLPQARVTRTRAGHFLQEEVPDELAAAVRAVALPASSRGVVTSPA